MQRPFCSCLGRSLRQAQQSAEPLGAEQARRNATKPAEPVVEKVEIEPGPPVITIQSLRASRGGAVATKAVVPLDADTSSPPSAASSVGAMSFGALGAVAIAALGVVGVYQMSAWVAGQSGRSMDADYASAAPLPILTGELLYARKAAMEAEYTALKSAPSSREVDMRILQLEEEAHRIKQDQ